MNSLEKKMVEILKTLRQKYGAAAVKFNLEAEGIRLEEIARTKEIVLCAGVDLTVKLGGCEALTDLRLAKMFGVNNIMAPMIESKFALEKYLAMVADEYADNELADMNLLINIETVDGYEKFDQILSAENIARLNGIVLGRTDLAKALGVQDVNAPQVLAIARSVFAKAKRHSLLCIVGGGTTPKSVPFFQALHGEGVLDGFETRKVVFTDCLKAEGHIEQGILLALQFEYHWYELKQQYYGRILREDADKMKSLAKILSI
ncbi:MAG: aldolase/citrate lyase family protein [Negativicutes bacterium]|nr:aldolase/citrate lyase family protein [Negativicutes bacterium]